MSLVHFLYEWLEEFALKGLGVDRLKNNGNSKNRCNKSRKTITAKITMASKAKHNYSSGNFGQKATTTAAVAATTATTATTITTKNNKNNNTPKLPITTVMAVVKRNQWQSVAVVAVKVTKETPKKSATTAVTRYFVCVFLCISHHGQRNWKWIPPGSCSHHTR